MLVMETIPLFMHAFRQEMRRNRPADMSVPQFRALMIMHHHAGASLTLVADHLGLALPTASKLIDGLVKRQLVARETSTEDRRRATLCLTAEGETTLESVQGMVRDQLGTLLSTLTEPERAALVTAMQAMQRIFAGA